MYTDDFCPGHTCAWSMNGQWQAFLVYLLTHVVSLCSWIGHVKGGFTLALNAAMSPGSNSVHQAKNCWMNTCLPSDYIKVREHFLNPKCSYSLLGDIRNYRAHSWISTMCQVWLYVLFMDNVCLSHHNFQDRNYCSHFAGACTRFLLFYFGKTTCLLQLRIWDKFKIREEELFILAEGHFGGTRTENL